MDIDIDQINRDELFKLSSEIITFLDALDFSERAYCEGWGDYDQHRADAEKDFAKLRSRIRGLAIAWGIHADFLREYTEFSLQSKLKIKAEKLEQNSVATRRSTTELVS